MHTYHSTLSAPARCTFSVESVGQAREILEHLTEERLIAGGTVVQAEAVNWVGGTIRRDVRLSATFYTNIDKLSLIRERLILLYGAQAPVLSQFLMRDESKQILKWIERNVQQ